MPDKPILLSELCKLLKEYPQEVGCCIPGQCCMHPDYYKPVKNNLLAVVKIHNWKTPNANAGVLVTEDELAKLNGITSNFSL